MYLPRHLRPLAIAAVVALAAVACGSDAASSVRPDGAQSDNAATLSDRSLSWDQLDELLPDGANTVTSRIASVLDNWLLTQALELELADRGYPITQADRTEAENLVNGTAESRSDTEQQLFEDTVALTLAAGRWSDDQGADLDAPEPPNYLCANHILLETEEDAEAALVRSEAGEDFAELAIELSTGPSGPDGGDLGCAAEGRFVPEFEEAAYAGSAGEVVGPVETQFGWHLIEIETVGPATLEVHPDADPAEFEFLLSQARELQIAELVQQLEIDAAITWGPEAEVDPSIGIVDPETLVITPA